ncbi:MAG: hypothetical protein ACKD6O_08095 [Candidatus Bathyarchaeota archaeon]
MIAEEVWFIFLAFISCFIIGLKFKQQFMIVISGLLALFLGFSSFSIYAWLGLIFLFAGLYIIYYGMFKLIKSEEA